MKLPELIQVLNLSPREKIQLDQVIEGKIDLIVDAYSLYLKLYDYFMCQMPYGTAKARDGDPSNWIVNRLQNLK